MANTTPAVVTRFAPSPTGELHIGGARTALFAWAYARRHDGKFLLRFEDTDQKRSSKQAEANILCDLEWLNLKSDNWGNNGDGIPRQSDRLSLYNDAISKLDAAGLVYEDSGALRLRMGKSIEFDDAVFGRIAVDGEDLEDFVIRKADGFPTFHLAVVVDDIEMGVTHVIRGQEHLTNTTKHAAIYDALGQSRPIWCHTPSIMNPDGSKMSKRDKAKAARAAAVAQGVDIGGEAIFAVGISGEQLQAFLDKENDDLAIARAIAAQLSLDLPEINVADFRRSGYTPAVLLNYLALLGWNPGNDLERFDSQYLVEHFDFDRIGRSNSKFDREKLAAFSQDDILKLTPEAWQKALGKHLAAYRPEVYEMLGDQLDVFASMYRERSRTLDDPAILGRFFFEKPTVYNAKAVKKNLLKNDGEGLSVLKTLREKLATIAPWRADELHLLVDGLWRELDLNNMGGVAQPLRVALTGNPVSPEIGPTLQVLGRDETLSRIDQCIESVSTQ